MAKNIHKSPQIKQDACDPLFTITMCGVVRYCARAHTNTQAIDGHDVCCVHIYLCSGVLLKSFCCENCWNVSFWLAVFVVPCSRFWLDHKWSGTNCNITIPFQRRCCCCCVCFFFALFYFFLLISHILWHTQIASFCL